MKNVANVDEGEAGSDGAMTVGSDEVPLLDLRRRRHAWEEKYRREPKPWRRGAPPASFSFIPPQEEIPEGPLLDLGSGGGKNTERLRRLFPDRRVIALDWVRSSLPPPPHVVAEASALPFRSQSLALVSALFLFNALPPGKERGVALEIQRVLRPGGILVFEDLARGDLRDGRFSLLRSRAFDLDETREIFDPMEVRTLKVVEKKVRYSEAPRKSVVGIFVQRG